MRFDSGRMLATGIAHGMASWAPLSLYLNGQQTRGIYALMRAALKGSLSASDGVSHALLGRRKRQQVRKGAIDSEAKVDFCWQCRGMQW
jgi:hypothetical protein